MRVCEQRLTIQVGENVVSREVRIHLRRVAQLELSARVRHHVPHTVHVRVPRHLEVVIDLDRISEAKACCERGVFKHSGVGHHTNTFVDNAGLNLLSRFQEQRLG